MRGRGDYDKAIADFTSAIRLNPKDAAAYDMRARGLEKKGEKKKAEQDFLQARSLRKK
jgi:Flp pilus assembly protein TadD